MIIKITSKKNKAFPAKLQRSRGFVILFAVTLSAILLSITLGVANITLKEIKFSTSAKDTNEAFFAADIGVECAFVHDKSTSSVFVDPNSPSFTCNNQTVTANKTPGILIWNFTISGLGNTGTGCAKVTVDKTAASTTITSKGYNKGSGAGTCTPGPNAVEREFLSTYNII